MLKDGVMRHWDFIERLWLRFLSFPGIMGKTWLQNTKPKQCSSIGTQPSWLWLVHSNSNCNILIYVQFQPQTLWFFYFFIFLAHWQTFLRLVIQWLQNEAQHFHRNQKWLKLNWWHCCWVSSLWRTVGIEAKTEVWGLNAHTQRSDW